MRLLTIKIIFQEMEYHERFWVIKDLIKTMLIWSNLPKTIAANLTTKSFI